MGCEFLFLLLSDDLWPMRLPVPVSNERVLQTTNAELSDMGLNAREDPADPIYSGLFGTAEEDL